MDGHRTGTSARRLLATYRARLNAAASPAASPADAAYSYVTDFECAGIPAASTREASAADVASVRGI